MLFILIIHTDDQYNSIIEMKIKLGKNYIETDL